MSSSRLRTLLFRFKPPLRWILALVVVVFLVLRPASAAIVLNFASVRLLPAYVQRSPVTIDASVCQDSAQFRSAHDALTWALSVDPQRLSTYTMLGRLMRLVNCLQEARAWLEQGYQHNPTDIMLALNLGQVYQALGDRDAAIRVWRSAPSIAVRHVRAGQRAVLVQDWDTAYAEFELAVSIDPENASAYRGLGQVLTHGQGRLEEGVQVYRRARALGEPDPYLTVEIAHALSMAGRGAEALQELDAVGIGGALADAIRGGFYLKTGHLDKAIHFLESSVRQGPDDPWTRHELAIAYAHRGLKSAAIAQLEAALWMNPDFQPARDLLACVSTAADLSVCVGP